MNILAVETSGEQASAALIASDRIFEIQLPGHKNHSERLLSSIEALLSRAGQDLSVIDALAFGAGPGAFTGLRLGCAVMQGLAQASELPLFPINSLLALATRLTQEKLTEGNIVVAVDARMAEIYTACFQLRQGKVHVLSEPVCISPLQLELPEDDAPWYAAGNAWQVYSEQLLPRHGERLHLIYDHLTPQAGDIARIASERLERGETGVSPEYALPLYIRDKVALTVEERQNRK